MHSVVFRGCSTLTQRHSCALNHVQWVFNTHLQAFTRTQSHSWSHHGESCSIMTQWRSCTLIGSHSLSGIHAHSIGVQGLFPLTHWHSCARNGCSGAVLTHSLAFMCTHKCSGGVQYSLKGVQPVQIFKGPIDMFSNMQSTLRPYKSALNFH